LAGASSEFIVTLEGRWEATEAPSMRMQGVK
jgi:hypothetical protein